MDVNAAVRLFQCSECCTWVRKEGPGRPPRICPACGQSTLHLQWSSLVAIGLSTPTTRLLRCRSCDGWFTAATGSRRLYCSRDCNEAVQAWRKRDFCAGGCGRLIFISDTSKPAGEATCRACRAAAVQDETGRLTATCPVCQRAFQPLGRRTGWVRRSCSRRCSALLRGGMAGVLDPRGAEATLKARERARCAKRRSRIASSLVEFVDPDVVGRRDGWRCHICGKRVDGRLSGRAAKGPTLDHLLPLAAGGEHSYANVALAHRSCNSSKGTRPANTQLALLG